MRINLVTVRSKYTMTPFEQVEQAFLHFCWTIKLNSYLNIYPPANKVDFDSPISVLDPTDPFHLPGDQFNTDDDIHLGAENCVLLSVGALFLALDTALDQADIKNDPSALDSFGQLRILIYMSRCAFAHNVLAPHWEVHGKYCRKLSITIPEVNLQLDLNQLSGRLFEIKQIGGYSQLIKMKDYILERLAETGS
jgi:hypothetical protein